MPEFTIDEATHEAAQDPLQLFLPAGINWGPEVDKILTAHQKALEEAYEARTTLEDSMEDYNNAIEADRIAFRKAALEGGKDPGDEATRTALRAVQFAHERYRAKRQHSDTIIGGRDGHKVMAVVRAGVVGYLEQALVQAEHYADIYSKTLFDVRERYSVAHNNIRTAYRVLGWFATQQGVIDFATPENPDEATFPQAGKHLTYLRELRAHLEEFMPEMERRAPKVFEHATP